MPDEHDVSTSSNQLNESTSTQKSAKYISVIVPRTVLESQKHDTSVEDLVLTDKAKALGLLKQVKGARMKLFDNYEDALHCSLEESTDFDPDFKPPKDVPSANYPTPTPPELSILRRAIEKGDINSFKTTVLSNPKFLITSSDTPVILMEGPRYNSVHIAAKSNNVDILEFILKTVNDPCFIRKLYPNDSDQVTEGTRKHLLDLYLNTPDKAALDTPLHFASKFAAADCVRLLLSYSGCDRERRNKFGEAPYDVICARKRDAQPAIKKKIKEYFEARFYVAINRELDRVTVCKPSETPPMEESISGIAGPMSPEAAEEIYHVLRSPAKSISPKRFQIRFTDGSRGLERVARMECRRQNLNWVEYWPFLNRFIDLASPEGIEALEEHLKKVFKDLTCKPPDAEEPARLIDSPEKTRNQSTISLLCDKLDNLAILSNQEISIQLDDGNGAQTGGDNPDTQKNSAQKHEKKDDDDPEKAKDPGTSDEEDSDYFETPPSSPVLEIDFYVNGAMISQSDRDAAIAISEVKIDPLRYPFVNQWSKKVGKPKSIPSPFRLPFNPSVSRDVYSTTPYSSTPRKSINLIDLISPRRFSFTTEYPPDRAKEEDEESDDDVFQDSICQFNDRNSDEENEVSASEMNKENLNTSRNPIPETKSR